MGTPCSNPRVTRKETETKPYGGGCTYLGAMETRQQRQSSKRLDEESEGKRGPGFRQLNARWWLLTELEVGSWVPVPSMSASAED